jgi:hypothetical protein
MQGPTYAGKMLVSLNYIPSPIQVFHKAPCLGTKSAITLLSDVVVLGISS